MGQWNTAEEFPGFHASTEAEYAQAFHDALTLPPEETAAMRRRARQSARRFTDRTFDDKWIQNMDRLVRLRAARTSKQ